MAFEEAVSTNKVSDFGEEKLNIWDWWWPSEKRVALLDLNKELFLCWKSIALEAEDMSWSVLATLEVLHSSSSLAMADLSCLSTPDPYHLCFVSGSEAREEPNTQQLSEPTTPSKPTTPRSIKKKERERETTKKNTVKTRQWWYLASRRRRSDGASLPERWTRRRRVHKLEKEGTSHVGEGRRESRNRRYAWHLKAKLKLETGLVLFFLLGSWCLGKR